MTESKYDLRVSIIVQHITESNISRFLLSAYLRNVNLNATRKIDLDASDGLCVDFVNLPGIRCD